MSPKDEREEEGYGRKVFDLALIRLRSDVVVCLWSLCWRFSLAIVSSSGVKLVVSNKL